MPKSTDRIPTAPITVHLPAPDLAALREIRASTGASLAFQIRRAVALALAGTSTRPPPLARKAGR